MKPFPSLLPLVLALICHLFVPENATAQGVRDDLDVLDGPNPTLRYGFYTESSGRVQMGRYYFVDDGTRLQVTLVAFGKAPVELPVLSFDRTAGLLELGWQGKADRTCRLQRYTDRLFLGNCVEALDVLPIAIRVANASDSEWMGLSMPLSETDIAILDRARKILVGQGPRNLEGDRNCDDDIAAGRFSVFCALYSASIEITGVYRHRRPVMQAVREHLQERYPGEYAHRLRDINNKSTVSDQELIEWIDSLRARLVSELQATARDRVGNSGSADTQSH